MSRLRVAIVMPLAEQRGGGELSLVHLAQKAESAGVDWFVVFLESGPLVARLERLGVECYVIEAGRIRQVRRWIATVRELRGIFRRRQVDLALGWMAKAQLYAGPAARFARVRSACYQLWIPSPRKALDVAANVLAPDGVLTVSHAAQAAQRRMRPRRRTALVYPGVELERFDSGSLVPAREARRLLGLRIDAPTVGIVGRLQRWKGIHVLIEAMPRIVAAHPTAQCLVVGGAHSLEPAYEAQCHRLVEDRRLGDHVVFAGFQTDVPLWMQAMDVVVHASQQEPLGIVVLEAMALRKAVIAGDQGGPAEVITHDVNGVLSPFGDPAALATHTIALFEDDAQRARLGELARERAEDFSTEHFARSLGEVLTRLATEPAARD